MDKLYAIKPLIENIRTYEENGGDPRVTLDTLEIVAKYLSNFGERTKKGIEKEILGITVSASIRSAKKEYAEAKKIIEDGSDEILVALGLLTLAGESTINAALGYMKKEGVASEMLRFYNLAYIIHEKDLEKFRESFNFEVGENAPNIFKTALDDLVNSENLKREIYSIAAERSFEREKELRKGGALSSAEQEIKVANYFKGKSESK